MNVFLKNTTPSAITVAGHTVYYIDSANAEVVTVKDANDNLYNAFKYNLNGTPYYYVIDNIHNTWTDDLSAWGYSEFVPVVLPNVYRFSDHNTSQSILPDYGFDTDLEYDENNLYDIQTEDDSYNRTKFGWELAALPLVFDLDWYGFDSSGSNVSLSPNGSNALVVWGSSSGTSYDSNNTYAVVQWNQTSGVRAGSVELSVVDVSGDIGVKNITDGTLSVKSVRIAECESTDVQVVTVYDYSRVAYNAFKYTFNNKDYYYVLDGVQEGWTDNLDNIGYNLYKTFLLAFTLNSSDQPATVTFSEGRDYYWSRITNSTDENDLSSLGMTYSSGYTYNSALYSSSTYLLELVGVYTDSIGTNKLEDDLSRFRVNSYTTDNVAGIFCLGRLSTSVTTWRVKLVPYLDVIVGLRWDPSNSKWLAKNATASTWWWCGITDSNDVSRLTAFGIGIVTKSDSSSQWCGTIGSVEFNPNYDYSIEELYSDIGENPVYYKSRNLFIMNKSTTGGTNYDNVCLFRNITSYDANVKTYRLRIKRGGNRNSCLYTNLQSPMVHDTWYPLYKTNGKPVNYTTSPIGVMGYLAIGENYSSSVSSLFSSNTILFRNNNGFLEAKQLNPTSDTFSVSVLIVIWD